MVIQVLTPHSQKQFAAQSIELHSLHGSLVIKEQHAPMVIPLLDNSEAVLQLLTGEQEVLTVRHGIAHVTRQSVTLLLSM